MSYYVHLHAKNYISYGNNLAGKKSNIDTENILTMYFNKHEQILKQFENKSEELRIKEMEKFYEKLFFQKSVKDNEEDYYNKLRSIYLTSVEEILQQQFRDKAGKINNEAILAADVEKGTSDYRMALKNVLEYSIDTLDTTNKRNQKQSYIKKVKQLREIINAAEEDKEFKNLLEMQLKQEKVARDIKQLKNMLKEILNEIGINEENINIKNTELIERGESFEKLTKIINAIGKLPYWGSQANQNGILGEVAASIYKYVGNNASIDVDVEVGKIVEDFVGKKGAYKGASYNNFNFEASPFSIDNTRNSEDIEVQGETLGIKISRRKQNKTVNKVDVSINVGENKVLDMSVKNYSSLKKNLTLVNGTPLSTLLSSMDKEKEFEGHLANLIFRKHKDENEHQDFLNNYRNQMISITKQQALINGFLGYSKTQPNIFVAFGSRSKEVKVFNMKAIIREILSEENSFSVDTIVNKKDINSIDNLTLSGNDGLELTKNAISLFENHKIHVAINLSNIDKLKKF